MHARSAPAAEALRAVAKFLRGLVETAEPLHRWREILSRAFQAFLKGRPLRAPLRRNQADATWNSRRAELKAEFSANCGF